MDVVSACPLRIASLVWQARPDEWVLTAVCKATYRLEPNVSPLADTQEHPNDDDNHWDDDPRKSVYAPGDLAPFKTRAEVLLVGNAFAPGGQSVPSLNVRLLVGDVDKVIAVHGDRSWTPDDRLREPVPFARMPLRYERAAGGPDTWNPVGMRPDLASPFGEIAVPNLWPPDRTPQQPGEIVEPIAFGPIAATWPARRDKLGPLARRFALHELARYIDPTFFSSAPRDQQLAELRSDESILLEHLHPRAPRFSTRLAGVAPRAFVERRGVAPQELALRADTLWIDTDRSVATLTWRGQVSMSAADEPGRVIVGMERGGQRLAWSDLVVKLARTHVGTPAPAAAVPAQSSRDAPSRQVAEPRHARDLAGPVQSSRGAPSQQEVDEAESLSEDDFGEAGDSLVLAAPTDDAASTMFLMAVPGSAAQTMPFVSMEDAGLSDPLRKAEQAAAAIRGQDLPVGWSPPSPFAADAPLPPLPDIASPEADFAVNTAMLPPPPAARPESPAPPPMVARPGLYDVHEPLFRPEPVSEVAVAGVLAKATDAGADAARLGMLGLSDAAAGAHRALQRDDEAATDAPGERAPVARARPAEILKLLWFDPRMVARLHRHPEWRILLAEMELRLLDEPEEDERADEDIKARRAVFEVLSRGAPSPADGLRKVLGEAVDERGAFEPPLVLLSGELELPFDEVEALKATVTVLLPLGPTDKKLKDALDAAVDFLKTPGAEQFGQLAQGLIERLREAFAQVRRTLPADYVDSHTERALLRQRAYSMKTLYGKRWIRALWRGGVGPAGRGDGGARGDGGGRGDGGARGPSSDAAPPVYLPEALKEELPAYKRIRIKALGEVDLQEDQEEAASWVVKVSALARVIAGL